MTIPSTVTNASTWTVVGTITQYSATSAEVDISGYDADGSTTLYAPGQGVQPFVIINGATVPTAAASYGTTELLHFDPNDQAFETAGGAPYAVGDAESVHKVTDLGDAYGSGTFTASTESDDMTLILRADNARGDSGFYSAPLVDPVIVAGMDLGNGLGDPSFNGRVNSFDATILLEADAAIRGSTPLPDEFVAFPTLSIAPATVDPTVEIESPAVTVQAGATVDTPVSITDDARGLDSASFVIRYNPSVLTPGTGDVRTGETMCRLSLRERTRLSRSERRQSDSY